MSTMRDADKSKSERQSKSEEARNVWPGLGLDRVTQDLRFGWRTLWKNPTFSLSVILTLALGIGANSAIFSVVDAVLLRPLPYAEPDRLVLLWTTSPSQPLLPLTPGNFYDFRARVTSLTGLAGISHRAVTLTGNGPAMRLAAMSVSTDFFPLLGVHAAIGRTFDPTDGPDARRVVLSDRLWRATFQRDASVVGRAVTLNGEPYVVTGVMASAFTMPSITPQLAGDDGPELWMPADAHEIPHVPMPISEDLRTNRRIGYVRAIGRLRSGVTLEAAQADVSSVAAALAREYPTDDGQFGARLVPFASQLLRRSQRPLTVVSLAVLIVLVATCANIAGLLLGRATARRKELAVRLALGASRRRVIQQLLTESLVLAGIAGACGLGLAMVIVRALIGLAPGTLLRLQSATLDGRTLAFTGGLSVITALAFGVLPAVQGSRAWVRGTLGESAGRTSDPPSRQRLRRILAGGEVALACVLLMGATLLGESLWTLTRVDPGYDARQVLAFEVFLTGPRAEYQHRQTDLYEDLLGRVRALPGVESAAAVVNLPVGGDDFGVPLFPEGRPNVPGAPGAREPRINLQVASAGYFHTMRIPLTEGRDFASGDTAKAPLVVIVNHALAQHYWPNGDAVGRRVRIGSADGPSATIVGVIGDVRHGGLSAPVALELYQPYTQDSFPFMSFVVRTSGDPLALGPPIRHALAEIDPTVPVSGVSTLDRRLSASVADTRFITTLLIAFSALALLLAAVGVYGVVALSVAQRTREIGIRLALGASRRDVMRLVLGQGAVVTVVGLAAGIGLSLVAGQVVEGLLFGVTPRDPRAFVAVPILLITIALVATCIPARRAARVAPSVALKSD